MTPTDALARAVLAWMGSHANEKAFWIEVRRWCLGLAGLIERRYGIRRDQ